MRIPALISLAGLVLLSGCVQTQATRLNQSAFAPVDPATVVVYLSEEDISARYERVALIHAQGSSTYTKESQMIEAAKRRAAKLGANGIVLGEVKEPSAGVKVAAAVFGVDTERSGKLLAVYVYPPEPEDED